MLRRWQAPFRKLRWKLTLSYTLVTVAALLVIELTGLALLQALLFNSRVAHGLAAQAVVGGADALRPYLDQDPPDGPGLNTHLQQILVNGIAFHDERGRQVRLDPSAFAQGESLLFVLNTRQQLMAVVPPWPAVGVGGAVDPVTVPGLSEVLPRALAGERDVNRLYATDEAGNVTVAAPVLAESGAVLGVLVFTSLFPVGFQTIIGPLVTLVARSLLIATAAAGLVGAVFGFLTARGLTRRLSNLEQTAGAWSQGDFSARAADHASDELGQLARRLNAMAEELRTFVQTRQALSALDERNRLARDLHDSVKQQVFAASMQLSTARNLFAADPNQAQAHLAEADRVVRQVQGELTLLIRQLRPAALEGQGLAAALREHVAEWSRQSGIAAEVRVQAEQAVSLPVEQALFRVAHEALANVARHSQASHVDVQLHYENGSVTLMITDDGRGFEPGTERGGVGLSSMRERMEQVGGQIGIVSRPRAGTRVEARSGIGPVA